MTKSVTEKTETPPQPANHAEPEGYINKHECARRLGRTVYDVEDVTYTVHGGGDDADDPAGPADPRGAAERTLFQDLTWHVGPGDGNSEVVPPHIHVRPREHDALRDDREIPERRILKLQRIPDRVD